jgi:hypothetical protein
MPRGAAEFFWQKKIPAEVAYYKIYHGRQTCERVPVTWKEIHAERAQQQRGILILKRLPDKRREAAILKVDSNEYGGYAFCKIMAKYVVYFIDYGRNPRKQQLCEYLLQNICFGQIVFDFKEWKKLFEQKIGSLPVFIELDRRGEIINIEIYSKSKNKLIRKENYEQRN